MQRFRKAICLLIVCLLAILPFTGSLSGQTRRAVTKSGQDTDQDSKDKINPDKPKVIQSYPDSGPEMRIALITDASTVSIGSTGEIDLQDGVSDTGWTVDADSLKFKIQQSQTIMARRAR